jgi:hypothetical protein
MGMQDIVQILRRLAELERLVKGLLAPKSKARVIIGESGGGEAVIGVTRTGGIAARTTTSVPHTFPSATIDLLNPDTGNFYSPNQTQVVHNSTSIAITALKIVQAKRMRDSDRYFVDVDDC